MFGFCGQRLTRKTNYRRSPEGGASPVPRGAGPAAASVRHACGPLRVAAPARRHELPDPQLGTRGFGQGRDVVGLGRWSFPTPHTNRPGRQEARTGLPVVVTPTRRRHRVTQPFWRVSGGYLGRRSLSQPNRGASGGNKCLGAGYPPCTVPENLGSWWLLCVPVGPMSRFWARLI